MAECAPSADPASDVFFEANLMVTINGFIFANADFRMNQYDKVRWFLLSLGSAAEDVHTAHFHGNTVTHVTDKGDVLMSLTSFLEHPKL